MNITRHLPFLLSAAAFAQTAEVYYFQAAMSPANEVPPIAIQASGTATITVHAVRNATGQVTSASVNFAVDYSFPSEATITGLHIHPGAAGTNGPVTVNTGISGAAPVVGTSGSIDRTAEVSSASPAAALETLNGLLTNPEAYYVNLHTAVNPGGVIRGQLHRSDERVFIGVMSPRNEIPAIDIDAAGTGSVLMLRTSDRAGNFVAGRAIFMVNYRFPSQVTFTGLHIHRGDASVNGPVVIGTPISGANSVVSAANGMGAVPLFAVNITTPAQIEALHGVYNNPGGFYINLHTTVNPGGAIRGQMRRTDRAMFRVGLSTANEVPPIAGLNASAPSLVTVDSLRGNDGNVTHAVVGYSVNHRFPGETTFTGLHIHDGLAGVNGPVRLNSGLGGGAASVQSTTGEGNIFRYFNAEGQLALDSVNSLLRNPENHYLNLHTTVNAGGAVRSQLAPVSTAVPSLVDVISAVSDPALQAGGQGGLITAFGRNLVKVSANAAGMEPGADLPASLNGTSVTVGGQAARLVMLGRIEGNDPPDYIVLQVPFETAPGRQRVVVTNSNGAGAAIESSIGTVAPAVFFDAQGAIALRPDLTLVRPGAPARAGELIGLVCTGLGQTNPALSNGQSAPLSPNLLNVAATVTATMGGRAAPVVGAYALPGNAGIYAVAIQVPAGLIPGNAATQIRAGETASNTVAVPVN
jgi:uncharacterized protein (TIGR03437 family)